MRVSGDHAERVKFSGGVPNGRGSITITYRDGSTAFATLPRAELKRVRAVLDAIIGDR